MLESTLSIIKKFINGRSEDELAHISGEHLADFAFVLGRKVQQHTAWHSVPVDPSKVIMQKRFALDERVDCTSVGNKRERNDTSMSGE
jgi:hypothetical protein